VAGKLPYSRGEVRVWLGGWLCWERTFPDEMSCLDFVMISDERLWIDTWNYELDIQSSDVIPPQELQKPPWRWLSSAMSHHPDDGGSKDLWNVGNRLPDYTMLQPRRHPSSYSPPWEPQILLKNHHVSIFTVTKLKLMNMAFPLMSLRHIKLQIAWLLTQTWTLLYRGMWTAGWN
jgi:hypothetical protein